jgi:hypothetical protein
MPHVRAAITATGQIIYSRDFWNRKNAHAECDECDAAIASSFGHPHVEVVERWIPPG